MFVELLLPNNKPIYVGTIYRSQRYTQFNEDLESIQKMLRLDCETIISGDTNICTEKKTSQLYKEYSSILRLFNLDQIFNEPTRIEADCSSTKDHLLCKNKDKIVQSGVISAGLSDHCLIFCTRKSTKVRTFSHNTLTIRCLKIYCKESFVQT